MAIGKLVVLSLVGSFVKVLQWSSHGDLFIKPHESYSRPSRAMLFRADPRTHFAMIAIASGIVHVLIRTPWLSRECSEQFAKPKSLENSLDVVVVVPPL